MKAFLDAEPGTWKFPEVGPMPWNNRDYIRNEGKFYCQEPGCPYGHVLLSVLKYVKWYHYWKMPDTNARISRKHTRTHYKLVHCTFCTHTCAQQKDMRRHFEETHAAPRRKRGRCPFQLCPARFVRGEESVNRHVRSRHPEYWASWKAVRQNSL